MTFTFSGFWRVGREQWRAPGPLWARMFTRLVGPLGMHARIRNAHVLRVLTTLDLPLDALVLDAGCGHAYTLFWLAQRFPRYTLIGIDQDPDLIAGNRAIAAGLGMERVTFVHGSVEEMSAFQNKAGNLRSDSAGAFPADTAGALPAWPSQAGNSAAFDLIVSIDLLEHVRDDLSVLRRFRRLLKPEGALVLHLPLRHQQQRRVFPAFRRHTVADHVRDEYTLDEIESKLAASGFGLAWRGWGFGPAGELAFELNYLAWERRWLRNALALFTFPLTLPLAYLDVRYPPQHGNSMLVLARPAAVASGGNRRSLASAGAFPASASAPGA